jgi:hypothetical protein
MKKYKEHIGKKEEKYKITPPTLWDDFLSFYSQFYEVTILESTYATSEGKMQVYF